MNLHAHKCLILKETRSVDMIYHLVPTTQTLSDLTSVECTIYLTARADFTSILRALFFSYGDHPLGIMVHDQTSLLHALMHETTICESLYSKRLVVFKRILARGTQSMFALQAKCRG